MKKAVSDTELLEFISNTYNIEIPANKAPEVRQSLYHLALAIYLYLKAEKEARDGN